MSIRGIATVSYINRLKKGVIVSQGVIYKYPNMWEMWVSERYRDVCELIISFDGVEAIYPDYPIIIDGVDDV